MLHFKVLKNSKNLVLTSLTVALIASLQFLCLNWNLSLVMLVMYVREGCWCWTSIQVIHPGRHWSTNLILFFFLIFFLEWWSKPQNFSEEKRELSFLCFECFSIFFILTDCRNDGYSSVLCRGSGVVMWDCLSFAVCAELRTREYGFGGPNGAWHVHKMSDIFQDKKCSFKWMASERMGKE